MIKEALIAQQIAIETYRDMGRSFGDKDATTRVRLARILGQEEAHAHDMHDLLVSREGRPTIAPRMRALAQDNERLREEHAR